MDTVATHISQQPSLTSKTEEQSLEERKRKVKQFLQKLFKDNYDILFLLIFIGAGILQFSYFTKTLDQPLWWDEAEYMSTAKHWAFGVPLTVGQRPPLFQLLAALMMKLGFSEFLMRFLLVTLPALLVIFAIYLLGKEMYNKKIGALSAAGSTLVWSYLFWSQRFQPDFYSIFFELLMLYFFWRLFKTDRKKDAIYAGIMAALALSFKIQALLIFPALFLFVLFKDGIKCFTKKNYWIAAGTYLVILIPFFIYNAILLDDPLSFIRFYARPGESASRPIGWYTLNFIYLFPKGLFFIFFIVGVGITLFNLALSFDFLMKNQNQRVHPGVLALLILLTQAAFYIFYTRGAEDRWLFMIIPFIFYLAMLGLTTLADQLHFNKYLPAIAILIAFLFFGYAQLQHTTQLIDEKKTSYGPVKESGLWIKQNSNPEDRVISQSYFQTTYYAEREVNTLAQNETAWEEFLSLHKPRYLIVSVFEPHPPWVQQWTQQNQQRLIPVQAYFADQEQKQPLLIIYEFTYGGNNTLAN